MKFGSNRENGFTKLSFLAGLNLVFYPHFQWGVLVCKNYKN